MNIPAEFKYSETHEWTRLVDDESAAIVGITDYAQAILGRLESLELLLAKGETVINGDEVGIAKGFGEGVMYLHTPLSGVILEINTFLTFTPAIVNAVPYEEGWMFKVWMSNLSELSSLLTATQYRQKVV